MKGEEWYVEDLEYFEGDVCFQFCLFYWIVVCGYLCVIEGFVVKWVGVWLVEVVLVINCEVQVIFYLFVKDNFVFVVMLIGQWIVVVWIGI